MVVDVLTIVSLVVGVVLGGLVVQTVTGAGPTISIGSVVGEFSSGAMQLHIPIQVHNGGSLAIQGVDVAVNVSDGAGHRLISGTSGVFDVPPGSIQRVNLTMTADMSALPQSELNGLLTHDESLHLQASLEASEPPLVNVHGIANGTLPWEAIMSNLTFSKGTVAPINSTYSQVVWQYSFTNRNQYFRLVADLTGVIKDQAGQVVGQVMPSSLEVKRGSSFNSQLTAVVADSALQPSGSSSLTLALQIHQTNLFQTQISVMLNA
jgi:hypothetical protein